MWDYADNAEEVGSISDDSGTDNGQSYLWNLGTVGIHYTRSG